MRRLLPVLAWCAVLTLLVLAWLRTPESGRLRADAQRILAAPIAEDGAARTGVAFPLEPGETRVKVVTWLTRPEPWARDVRATTPYRLDLAVRSPDGEVRWSARHWLRSRASWIAGPGARLLRPSWLPDARDEVTDSRVTEIDVTDLCEDGAELVVRALVPPRRTTTPAAAATGSPEVLTVAYRHALRTPAARLRALAAADADRADARAADVTPRGWSDLPRAWQERLAERVWERLSPVPAVAGQTVGSAELMHAAPDESRETQPSLGLPVAPGMAAAFNLRSGARVVARWRDGSGQDAAPAPTWLQRVGPDGVARVEFLGVVDEIGPVEVQGPLESVQLALDPGTVGPRMLQLRELSEHGGVLAWGDPPRAPAEGQGAWGREGGWRLAPDLRGVELVRLGGDHGAARFPVEAADDALRLSVRVPLAAGPGPAFGRRWDPGRNETVDAPRDAEAERRVTLRALGADGTERMAWEVDLSAVPSAFERYTQGDDPGTARASEPVLRTLVPPPGTVRLEVDADGPVDVALRARRRGDPPARVAPGYGLPSALAPPPIAAAGGLPEWEADGDAGAASLVDARYVPAAQSEWRQRGPEEADQLLADGRVVRMDAQVRIESRDLAIARSEAATPTRAPTAGDPTAEDPTTGDPTTGDPTLAALAARTPRFPLDLAGDDGGHALLAEPDLDGDTRVGGRTRVASPDSGAVRARVPVDATGRLDVEYRVDPEHVGRTATFTVDGRAHPETLASSAGRVRLTGLSPGARAVAVDVPGLFLARADGTPRWQARRVVRLDPGQRLRIPFPEGPAAVLLFAYAADPGTGGGAGRTAGWLDWQLALDQPRPPAALGRRSTRQAGRHPLRLEGGQAWPLSFRAGTLARLRPLRVDVAEDAAGGHPVLTLTLSGASGPVWLRALASWPSAADPADATRALVVPR